MTEAHVSRPDPGQVLSGAQLRRWYWLKEELIRLARSHGVSPTGSKELLTARIAAHLDHEEFAEPAQRPPAPRTQLGSTLTATSIIPEGQRCSQVVRHWLQEHAGRSFRFDAHMRDFFAHTDGNQTMDDALQHWQQTRNSGPTTIDRQFEYNRFTRAWRAEHTHGDQQELLAAWRRYRSAPIDERGRI